MMDCKHECTCGGKGWELRGIGKNTQWRICQPCWDVADPERRDEIQKELEAELASARARVCPSGRFA